MDWRVSVSLILICNLPVLHGYFPLDDFHDDIVYDGPLISPNNHIYDNIGYFPIVFPKATTTTTTTTAAPPPMEGVAPLINGDGNALIENNGDLNPTTESPDNGRTNIPPFSSTTASPPRTTSGSPSGSTSTDNPTGFSASNRPVHLVGFHIKGGIIVGNNVTNSECKKLCEEDESCLAVDYDSFNRMCWKHGENTYCGALRVQLGTAHYKKVSCKRKIDNLYKEITLGAFFRGGARFCCPCSLSACLYMCAQKASGCLGVDYNWRGRSCYSHNNETSCGTVVASKHTTHYSKLVCDSTIQTSKSEYWNTLGTIENLTAGSKVVYIRGPAGPPGPPGPAGTEESAQENSNRNEQLSYQALKEIFLRGMAEENGFSLVPATDAPEEADSVMSASVRDEEEEPVWTEYPKYNIPKGDFLLDGITKEQCKDLCEGDTSCVAVDYNQYNEGCWYHNNSRTCDEMTESEDVFHMRKQPCEDLEELNTESKQQFENP